ncbi:hypothetical protein SALBM311S_03063 [Streptomyces alboniger]
MLVRPKRYATRAIATAATAMVSRLCAGTAALPRDTQPSTRLGKSRGWSSQIVLMALSAMSETPMVMTSAERSSPVRAA